MPRAGAAAVVTALFAFHGSARAADESSQTDRVDTVAVYGNTRTRRETLLELLPRRPPATFSTRELAEVERRIDNLAIFDRVSLERHGTRLEIHVREKWTLIPNVDFASSKTLADTYALVGLTEYNAFGTGNQLGLSVYREQRGWGAVASYIEHPYRRHRWALAVDASASTAQFRFADESGWKNTLLNFELGFISPPWLSDHLNYKVGAYYAREIIRERVGEDSPPSSHALGTSMVFTWDAYRWADFVPRGVRAELWFSSGAFLGTPVAQPRHLTRLHLVVAQPLARYTVLTARAVFAASTRGNAGFSQMLGSIEGVRGLEDGLYRNWLQAFANLELRQAVPIAERWAVQGVLFGDAAAFEQLEPNGGRGAAEQALSVGSGLRVIPTWLANVVIRVDVARLIAPYQTWFTQVGINQYF
ncbi:MAG: hypothetical protein ABW061_18030 [Polyangiaceae bacterium]